MTKRNIAALKRHSDSVISESFSEINRQMSNMRKMLARVRNNRVDIQLTLMTLMAKAGGIFSHAFVSTSWDEPKLHVSLYGAESFKDPRVINSLAYLTGSFESDETVDYASALNREYRFKGVGFNVTLDVTVRSDSPTCRKVKVKEEIKTFTDAVYKIECD